MSNDMTTNGTASTPSGAVPAGLRDAEVSENRDGMVQADPSTTSARSARLVAPRSGTQRARLLTFIVEAPAGATDYEAERDLGLLGNAVRPRRNELVGGGYLTDSGTTRRHRGSDWIVWQATDEARAWYQRQAGAA